MQVTLRGKQYPVKNCSDDLVQQLALAVQSAKPAAIAQMDICFCIKEAIPDIPPELCSFRLIVNSDGTQEVQAHKNLDADELAEIIGAISVAMLERRIERLKEFDDPRATGKIKELSQSIAIAKEQLSNIKVSILLGESIEVKTLETNGLAAAPVTVDVLPVLNGTQLAALESDAIEENLQSEVEKLRAELAKIKESK